MIIISEEGNFTSLEINGFKSVLETDAEYDYRIICELTSKINRIYFDLQQKLDSIIRKIKLIRSLMIFAITP